MIPRNHDLHGHLTQITPAHDVHDADYWANELLLLTISRTQNDDAFVSLLRPTNAWDVPMLPNRVSRPIT